MTRWSAHAASVGAALILAGCSGDGAAPESGAESKRDATPTASAAPVPQAGQCYDSPRSTLVEHVDPTRPVGCDELHTLETAHVVTTTEPITSDNVGRHASRCRTAFRDYVGGSDDISRLDLHFVVADSRTQAAGRHWLRCDVVAKKDTQLTRAESRTGSVRDALADGVPDELRACLDSPPDPESNQPYVACDRPHVAELVDEPVTLGPPEEAYPGRETLARRAESACEELVTAESYAPHVGTNWLFPSEQQWRAGDRTGACWVSARLPSVDAPAAPTTTPTATPAG